MRRLQYAWLYHINSKGGLDWPPHSLLESLLDALPIHETVGILAGARRVTAQPSRTLCGRTARLPSAGCQPAVIAVAMSQEQFLVGRSFEGVQQFCADKATIHKNSCTHLFPPYFFPQKSEGNIVAHYLNKHKSLSHHLLSH